MVEGHRAAHCHRVVAIVDVQHIDLFDGTAPARRGIAQGHGDAHSAVDGLTHRVEKASLVLELDGHGHGQSGQEHQDGG